MYINKIISFLTKFAHSLYFIIKSDIEFIILSVLISVKVVKNLSTKF